tara:strand:- start:8361 stop:9254 length:894 start_codon:yes stop_codon:yes gene_type:complete
MKLKIGFIGCVKSSQEFLNVLLEMQEVEVCAVVTKSESSINSDFTDLTSICESKSIPYHLETSGHKNLSRTFLKKYDLDLIYCFGWSYLLQEDMLSLPKICTVGFHPAKLPKNRGRHPIIWAIALGLKETASTFFRMEKGADTGDIINQKDITIGPDDSAQDLYTKIINCGKDQIKEFTMQFFYKEIKMVSQDHNQATSWRKRTREDGLIDWRMPAESIYNLVRALSPPYPCAEFKIGDKFIKVPRCSVKLDKYPLNIEPGYILERSSSSLLVKVSGKDAVLIEGLEIENEIEGDYL